MKLYLLLFCALNAPVFAQFSPFDSVNTSQSASGSDWYEINTDRVRLIFPLEREESAQQVASLVDFYSQHVGQTYGVAAPKKFPLILRPGMSLPNGFVTLSPRRSEWFSHDTYIPFIGGLSFNDALAIHEYRHVIQYDYSLRSTNTIAYSLFGQNGLAFMDGIGLPNWYFEGDAVWSETHFTQGGRGRSPRFSARLKALIISGMTPTYDELVGRTYNTFLPNHYVFGYYFIGRSYEKFGEKFWQKVVADVAKFSLSPYRIYSSFEKYSGVDFDDFVRETFEELKRSWEREGDHLSKTSSQNYTRMTLPMIDGDKLYYLKKGLNEYWGLYENGVSEVINIFPLSPDSSKTDLKAEHFVYTQYLPNLRYSYKTYNDLFVYDLKSGELERWSEDKRIYHPQWSPSGKTLGFVEYRENGLWSLGFKTSAQDKIHYINLKNLKPFEIAWASEQSIYILAQNPVGKKLIYKMNLQDKNLKKIITGTRNNLYALRATADNLFFEGDWQGRVQVFKLTQSKLSQCSDEVIAAYTPIESKGDLYYSVEAAGGQRIKKRSLSKCTPLALTDFLGKKRLTEASPTDSLVKSTEVETDEKVISQKYQVREYSQTWGGMAPHSWNLLGGDGYQLGVFGTNYLGTVSWSAAIGYDREQKKPFSNFAINYAKYFPIFGAYTSLRQRRYNYLGSSNGADVDWTEKEAGLKVTLPFRWVKGFFSHDLKLSVDTGLIGASSKSALVHKDTLRYHSAGISWKLARQKTFQQIYTSWGINFHGFYRSAKSKHSSSINSDIIAASSSFFLPSFFENHGIKLSVSYQGQTKGIYNYRHEPVQVNSIDYTLSRGYNYSYLDSFTKYSLDYALPLLHPDLNLWGWAYIRRIYAVPFYDMTNYQILTYTGKLKSFGVETYLETNLFRRFPLTLGARYSYRQNYRDHVWDFLLRTKISY